MRHDPSRRSRYRRAPRPVSWRTILVAVGASAALPLGLWAMDQPLAVLLVAAAVGSLLGWTARTSTRR